jgi:hypothetical protein
MNNKFDELAKVMAQSVTRRRRFNSGWSGLEPTQVFIELYLQLPYLFQRPLRQHCEVAGIPGQNVVPVRLENTLHPPHLFDGLIDLFRCLDHNVNRNKPFFAPGCCRTWIKNARAWPKLSLPFLTTTTSKPKRLRTRRCASTLYWWGGKSAPKSLRGTHHHNEVNVIRSRLGRDETAVEQQGCDDAARFGFLEERLELRPQLWPAVAVLEAAESGFDFLEGAIMHAGREKARRVKRGDRHVEAPSS